VYVTRDVRSENDEEEILPTTSMKPGEEEEMDEDEACVFWCIFSMQ
jgi:hypothetical protein